MSSKPESTFIASVHRHLPLSIHREKMANPYRGGTADCWYSYVHDLWIEYKFIPRIPVRVNILPDCSALQLEWLKNRHNEGRKVFVIVGCPTGGVVFTDRTWEQAVTPQEFKIRVQDRKTLAKWITDQVSERHTSQSK